MQPSPFVHSVADQDIRLFRHSKRPNWGVAALVWERDGKRGYQFADGNLRVFKEGFYALFQSALPPGDGSAVAVRRLARLAQCDDVTEATRLPTLRDQIALFSREYDEGFLGKAWQGKHRAAAKGRRLKRHRDPAVADATRLSLAFFDDAIERRAWVEVRDTIVEVLSGSDLVSNPHLAKLRRLQATSEFAHAVREWLYGGSADESEVDHDRRFNVLVRTLGDAASWPLVTSLAGLVHPTLHTCVRESSFVTQGKMLLAKFSISRRPLGSDYRRLNHVAHSVRRELDEAGLATQDLLDVYDFIWLTLRPAARDDLLSVPLVTKMLQRADAPVTSEAAASEQAETEQLQVEAA